MLVALAAAFTACKKGMVSSETISVSTDLISTRADGDVDVTLQPLFLFWTGSNFNSTTATAPDFFVRTADGVIDDYKTTKYNTKVYYPLYDEVVYANGVAYVELVNGSLQLLCFNFLDNFKCTHFCASF